MTARLPQSTALILLCAAAMLVTGLWLVVDGSRTAQPPQPTGADSLSADPGGGRAAAAGTARPLPASTPLRITIPRISVNAPLTPLGLDASGHLQVPPDQDRNLAGWYRDGPAPGSAGAAIIDGHVDNWHGPAVFYGLGALHRGDTIEIGRRDRTTAVFRVDAVEVYGKNRFPSRRVYGPTPDPELRVITCGGGYARGSGYLGNVVVYAHLTPPRPDS
jgi:hypothetical protein